MKSIEPAKLVANTDLTTSIRSFWTDTSMQNALWDAMFLATTEEPNGILETLRPNDIAHTVIYCPG